MNCTHMLAQLLEAEHAELEGTGASAVAVHVRQCARCRAVASRVLADTHALAAHASQLTSTPARRRTSRARPPRPIAWAGALAAAVLFAVMLMRQTASPPAGAVDRPAATVAAATPAAPTRDDARAPERGAGPVHAARFADVSAATPVRFVASQSVEQLMPPVESGGVSVAPPAGTRSAVLATRNPKITVVWLY